MEKETEDFSKEAFQQTLDAKTNLMQDFHGQLRITVTVHLIFEVSSLFKLR
jgi:hypothetical protein